MGTKKASTAQRATLRHGVADALFSSVQQRVLGVLFGNAGRSYYANEIIALAGSGTGAVQRELARLENAGLVTVRRLGRQKHYQANPDSPIFAELRALVLKTAGLADVLRSCLAPLAPRIHLAFIFGSVAKGEDTASSDADVMIVADDLGYADVFAAFEDAASRLGRQINPTIYTVAEFARRRRQHNAFVTRVLAQPKIWLIGSDRELAA